jgi:hypothetical protein
MPVSVVQVWRTLYNEDLTELAIHNRFAPPSAYRITRHRYPAGAKFSGSSRAGFRFILSGACTIKTTNSVTLRAGEFVECLEGNFEFAVLGDHDVEEVAVWSLREVLGAKGTDAK